MVYPFSAPPSEGSRPKRARAEIRGLGIERLGRTWFNAKRRRRQDVQTKLGAPGTPPKPGLSVLGRPLAYLRDHRLAVAGALVSVLLVLGANLSGPLLIRYAIDEGIGGRDQQALVLALAAMVVLAGLRGVFGFLQVYLAERVSHHVAYRLRDALFAKIQRLSFSYFDRSETGQLLTRLTNDVDQVRGFIGSGIVQIVQSVVMFAVSVTVIMVLDWRLALVTLLALAPIALVLGRFTRLIGPLFGRIMHHVGQMNTVMREALAGVRIVRTFGRQAHEAARYDAVNAGLLEQAIAASRAGSNTFPLIMLFANLGTLAIVGLGGWQVMDGRMTIGTLLAFTSYLGFLLIPIMTLGFTAMILSRASVSAGRIAELFDAPLDVTDRPGAVALPPIVGAVAFEQVGFRYPGSEQAVLSDVSFTVAPGETVAIVGMTGSGKSTLAHLVPRFYDASAGTVRVDGHDVKDVTLASLRGQIAIVLQEPLLFGGTIADNVAYGRPSATREEVELAARAARADDFIRGLDQGYDTVIGERGVGLSGGQRQRIAIARALLVDPRLIILDDSTSAVDAETEAAIQASLDRLMRDHQRTCLVIAHRFSTVREADRILVLHQGRLVAEGSHAELMASSPVYQDIVGTQLSKAEAASGQPGGAS
jgi:ATP-binding cassette subfamily B protein